MTMDTRTRMILGAAKAIATGGIDAMSLRSLAESEGVPLGSMYHHFPGGKAALAEEAVRFVGVQVTELIEQGRGGHARQALLAFADRWRRVLDASDYRSGCPVAAAATSSDARQRQVAREVFADWHRAMSSMLVDAGVDRSRAPRLARTILAATEGALALARAAGSSQPLNEVTDELYTLLGDAVPGQGTR
ncbi:hypothetical protein BAY59_26430 [Prauserella coralliicola]|nr:hypothetical protein BAY59_26430 [Prauserella coralliicola]